MGRHQHRYAGVREVVDLANIERITVAFGLICRRAGPRFDRTIFLSTSGERLDIPRATLTSMRKCDDGPGYPASHWLEEERWPLNWAIRLAIAECGLRNASRRSGHARRSADLRRKPHWSLQP